MTGAAGMGDIRDHQWTEKQESGPVDITWIYTDSKIHSLENRIRLGDRRWQSLHRLKLYGVCAVYTGAQRPQICYHQHKELKKCTLGMLLYSEH